MFRSIAYLATNDDVNHINFRLLLQRFENLNKKIFDDALTGINKPQLRSTSPTLKNQTHGVLMLSCLLQPPTFKCQSLLT